ncbi:MAG: hypothetical protein U5J63_17600 [Fodinibius sp.]|nr:hypothetical protein [Fodinibius sp.]
MSNGKNAHSCNSLLYVSPAVVDEMVEQGKEPQLGGDEVYITAFFSDIQSFSTFSETVTCRNARRVLSTNIFLL